MGSRGREAGQHLAEFTFVIGVAAIAAISMTHLSRRAIQRGVQSASDVVLGPAAARPGCLDTSGDGRCDCEDSNRDGACDDFTSNATQRVTETGQAGGRRTTTFVDSGTGQSEGQYEAIRQFPNVGRRRQPEPPPPPDDPFPPRI